MRHFFIATAIVVFMSPAIAQQTYRWVDENGQVHYSAEKPTGKAVQTLNIPSGPSKKPQPTKEEAPQDENKEAIQFTQEIQQKAAQDAEQTKTACTNLRKNLAVYQNYPKAKLNVDGTIRRLTEEELKIRIVEAEKNIKENCQDN